MNRSEFIQQIKVERELARKEQRENIIDMIKTVQTDIRITPYITKKKVLERLQWLIEDIENNIKPLGKNNN